MWSRETQCGIVIPRVKQEARSSRLRIFPSPDSFPVESDNRCPLLRGIEVIVSSLSSV